MTTRIPVERSPLPHRMRYSLVCGPAVLKARPNSRSPYSCDLAPFGKGSRGSQHRDAVVVALIALLLPSGCPTHIAGVIPLGVVDSVEAAPTRANAEMRQKSLETSEFVADAEPGVDLVILRSRIRASVEHIDPNAISACPAHSVSALCLCRALTLQTPARLSFPTGKRRSGDLAKLPAFTLATVKSSHLRTAESAREFLDDGQPCDRVAGQILESRHS